MDSNLQDQQPTHVGAFFQTCKVIYFERQFGSRFRFAIIHFMENMIQYILS